MASKEAYREKMDARLKELSATIDVLKARAEGAAADAKIKYQKQLQEVQSQRETVSRKLDELASASEEKWAVLRSGVESAWDRLKQSVDEARRAG